MAQDIQPRIVRQVAAPQHFSPPSPRELRSQALHRLQVGLFGLCAMLLLIGLANIIMDRARLAEQQDPGLVDAGIETKTPAAKPADPLADLGVAPAADPSSAAAAAKKKQ